MSKHFFDYDDGDFAYTVSDNMAIDSDGNMLMRMGITWPWIWTAENFTLFRHGIMKTMTIKKSL